MAYRHEFLSQQEHLGAQVLDLPYQVLAVVGVQFSAFLACFLPDACAGPRQAVLQVARPQLSLTKVLEECKEDV